MSRTDKDEPFKVRYPDWEETVFYDKVYRPCSGDSGFRVTRRWLKRRRNKNIRRYSPESNNNGAKQPYNGLRRTWDFE